METECVHGCFLTITARTLRVCMRASCPRLDERIITRRHLLGNRFGNNRAVRLHCFGDDSLLLHGLVCCDCGRVQGAFSQPRLFSLLPRFPNCTERRLKRNAGVIGTNSAKYGVSAPKPSVVESEGAGRGTLFSRHLHYGKAAQHHHECRDE